MCAAIVHRIPMNARILIWILLLYIYLVNILQIAMSTRVDRGRFRLVDCELRIPCIYDMCDCTHVYVYAYMVCVHAIEQAIYVPVVLSYAKNQMRALLKLVWIGVCFDKCAMFFLCTQIVLILLSMLFNRFPM